ncbi:MULTISPECIES: DUF4279 domain-containing protein [Lelliottia]|uniref:DUF4279 domain-containing protein n=1 Tax=Lelliottia wanjuensis TaxID=3050585 RepID=A0AAP4CZA1_9ENTR|nr:MULTISPECIES: DUF4279 domain-containing protein [unclassified Lelliottia]MDK9357368.1 DUF4279 domain-containing protein [Lelliottia sp. V106_16]MDK9362261.1 DUF4279 domain-containing protein [Lelliottia sp. V106_12]MDK9373140.1 DUF4279 domain-containing protein [Lelliottia sp. V106_10]MDK9586560.1 DUF4279 domain-containing protein [Lelliottia sp. V86_10]MDK9599944.1 DUF4279 domain-containing protein [Lelliottia sp. V106_5]
MNKTTVMAYFSIYGDCFDTDYVTQEMSLTPTEVRLKGNIPNGKKRPSVETSWKLSTFDEESNDVNIQLDKIINLLEGKESQLKCIKNKYEVSFTFTLVIKIENGEKQGMHFNAKKIDFINEVGAEIDIDLYIYS